MNFSEKLSSLMMLTELTNSKMARALNVDPSLVSRWCNGSRRPAINSPQMATLSEYISSYVNCETHVTLLSALIAEGNEAQNYEDADAVTRAIYHWLNNESSHIFNGVVPTSTKIPRKRRQPKLMQSKAFFGVNGSKLVLERIYGILIKREKPQTIRFYSNNAIDWFNMDVRCRETLPIEQMDINDGIESIHILINRDAKRAEIIEMLRYLMAFMNNATIRVSQIPCGRCEVLSGTVFIVGDAAAASCQGFSGSENYITNLYLDKRFIQNLAVDYDELFNRCTPVHTITENITLRELLDEKEWMLQKKQPILFVGNTLSPLFLGANLLHQLCIRARMDAYQLSSKFETYQALLVEFLREQTVTLNIPLYEPEEIADGAMCIVGIPRFMDNYPVIDVVFYIKILERLHQLLQDHPNLHICPRKDFGHEHNVYIQQHTEILVNRTREPYVSYKSNNMEIVEAFSEFITDRYGTSEQARENRDEYRDILKNHIEHLYSAQIERLL